MVDPEITIVFECIRLSSEKEYFGLSKEKVNNRRNLKI